MDSLKHGQVRYDGCVDNKGVRGVVSEMGQSKIGNPEIERKSGAQGDKGKRTKCNVKVLPNIEVV